jgi:hypothetical protein
MRRAGVKNHLVVALDDFTRDQVQKWGSTAVKIELQGQEEEKALKTGSSHAVSGMLAYPTSMHATAQTHFGPCCQLAFEYLSTVKE